VIDPQFYHRNKVHISRTATVLTASSTDVGYAIDNSREDGLGAGWKPINGTSDQWLQADLGDTTQLGSAAGAAYFAVAYDARGCDQTKFTLQYDSADNPAFSSPVDVNNLTLQTASTSLVNCDLLSFSVPTPAKRYYRIMQKNSDRGGGTKVATILYWGLFPRSTCIFFGIGQDFTSDTISQYKISDIEQSGVARTAGNVPLLNQYAKRATSVQLTFDHATQAFWDRWRSDWDTNSNAETPQQAVFCTLQGLYNIARPGFFLCRMASLEYQGVIENKDLYNQLTFTFESEPYV